MCPFIRTTSIRVVYIVTTNHLSSSFEKKYSFTLQAIPWSFYEDSRTRFWVHYGLVIFGFVLAVITIIAQWAKPAPYGKHESNVSNDLKRYNKVCKYFHKNIVKKV